MQLAFSVFFLTTLGFAHAKNEETVLLVCFDGLDIQTFQSIRYLLPNFNRLAEAGVSGVMHPIYPTKTWPNLQTLMTGQYAETHGIVSNNFFDPVYNLYWGSGNASLLFKDSEPLWLTNQRQNKDSAVYHWSGTQFYSDKPKFYEPPFPSGYFNSSSPAQLFEGIKVAVNETSSKLVKALTSADKPNFVAIYVDFPDGVGHRYGPDSTEYKTSLQFLDSEILGRVVESLKTAGIYDDLNIIVVSDHGMYAPHSVFHLMVLSDYLDPNSYFLSEESTVVHIWPKPGKEDEIVNNLTSVMHKNFTVYRKSDIPDKYHWKHNRRIPPVVVLPKNDYLIRRSRVKPEDLSKGDHGFPVDWPRMNTLFFARGRAFKKNYTTAPFVNVDVYPLIVHLLGITGRPHNGSTELMKSVLKDEYLGRSEGTAIGKGNVYSVVAVTLLIGSLWTTL